ncbi:murein hydrolase activator EnvC [Bartonella sp. DGB1]|uniref:murein hydrolase activator EnvC family protein n=1 Tax=Bartonella sp. DGB1 TaxID=3239807 RepID=UPI003524E6D6
MAIPLFVISYPLALEQNGLRAKWVEANQKIYDINMEINISEQKISQLKQQVNNLKKDINKIKLEIKKTEEQQQLLTQKLEQAKKKFDKENDKYKKYLNELDKKDEQLAYMLAMLQKLTLSPPPVMLISTKDILNIFRGSLLLGSITSEIQQKTESIKVILAEIAILVNQLDKDYLIVKKTQIEREEKITYLALLKDEQQKIIEQSSNLIINEQQQIDILSQEQQKYLELLNKIKQQQSKLNNSKAVTAHKKLLFKSKKLPFPIDAKLKKRFGDKSLGLIYELGDILEFNKDSKIKNFTDAIVLFAGEFRTYGKLLILDVGDNYQLIVAGLSKINVKKGDFIKKDVIIGELEKSLTDNQLLLYLELRKDNKSINLRNFWQRHKT